MRNPLPVAVTALVLLTTSGCAVTDGQAEGPAPTVPSAIHDTAGTPTGTDVGATDPAGPADPTGPEGGTGPTPYGLALLATPQEATHLTVTDFDAVRVRLGVPDLTSEDLMTDRLEFWRSAEASTVLVTDGLLREENSRYDLTYGFTQDDVDAEAHWTAEGEGGGWLLQLRPDLDPGLVRAAVDDGAPEIGDADWDPGLAVLSQGVATGGAVWASDPALAALGEGPAETLVVRSGCVPFTTALGIDATVEDQDAVLDAHDVEALVDVEAVAVAFTGMSATVQLVYPDGTPVGEIEADLHARVALGEDWPTTEAIGFADGFGAGSVAGVTGRIGELEYAVTHPGAAATLVLADLVPLGVCTDVEFLEEPTGL